MNDLSLAVDVGQAGDGAKAKKKMKEALEIFEKNCALHPASWNAWDSLGETQALQGDKKAATESSRKALSLAKAEIQQLEK